VLSQPTDELDDIGVSPHPSRKSLEPGKRVDDFRVAFIAVNEPVYTVRVGPIGFDGDRVEVLFFDQALCDFCALFVELMGAMRCPPRSTQASHYQCAEGGRHSRLACPRGDAQIGEGSRQMLVPESALKFSANLRCNPDTNSCLSLQSCW
jgi:hypothetical protein